MSDVSDLRWFAESEPKPLGEWFLLGLEVRGDRVLAMLTALRSSELGQMPPHLQLLDVERDVMVPLRWVHQGGSGAEHQLTFVFEGGHADLLKIVPEVGLPVVVDLRQEHPEGGSAPHLNP